MIRYANDKKKAALSQLLDACLPKSVERVLYKTELGEAIHNSLNQIHKLVRIEPFFVIFCQTIFALVSYFAQRTDEIDVQYFHPFSSVANTFVD